MTVILAKGETRNDGRSHLWQALTLGLVAAAFFSVSFVLNRRMAQADGHWAWSAALRFLMMMPVLAVLVSATAHPIGNRRSILLLEKARLPSDPILRLSLLILGSLPFWLALCGWGMLRAGLPSSGQLATVGFVAATGLIATPLFYAATDRVSRDPGGLAAVESTQASEIVFTMVFEALLIGIRPPTAVAWVGLSLILLGFILHARPPRRGKSKRV